MMQGVSVTAEALVRALKRRKAALPAEIGSFVVLEACEMLEHTGPRLLSPADVLIHEDGSVRLAACPSCSEEEAAEALHRVLASMLVAAGPAPLPALMRLLEEGPSSGRWTVRSMKDDLEASLVPLNRKASRRVLSRFVRETGWAERVPQSQPTFEDLDSELSSLLDEPRPGRISFALDPVAEDTFEDAIENVDDAGDQVRFFESARPPARETVRPKVALPRPLAREATQKTVLDELPRGATPSGEAETSAPSPAQSAIDAAWEGERARAPSLTPAPRPPRELSDFPKPQASRTPVWGIFLVVLSVAIALAALKLRPELLGRLTGSEPVPERKPPQKVEVPRPEAGDLVVRVSPERAQVLRFVGRGPVTVAHLPLGVAHEFVAISGDLAPARLLVPKDAEWEQTADGPRYEAAMQLGAESAAPLDLGESRLPQDVGAPRGGLGSVRIVTTPKGAKVYQVIGFAPEARLENVPLASAQELLIYRPGYVPALRVVGPSDYTPDPSSLNKRAELDVTLEPSPRK